MKIKRLNELSSFLNDNGIDLAIINNFKDIQYFTSFSSNPLERTMGILIFPNNEPLFYSPSLEKEAIKKSGWPFDIVSYNDGEDIFSKIKEYISKKNIHIKNIGIQKPTLTISVLENFKKIFPDSNFGFNVYPKINEFRMVKEKSEIKKLFTAGEGADLALSIGFDNLSKNITEKELSALIEYEIKKSGIEGMSFDPLVQFGSHASDPHGITSNKKIENNNFVLFDLGTLFENYISDVSRTIFVGKPNQRQEYVYNAVAEAQQNSLLAAKPGVTSGELDSIARNTLKKYDLDKYFIHRLGHGVGMSEHEEPEIIANSDFVLKENMAFSLEPGVYIPGELGIRIEDSVILEKNSAVPFTKTTKDLLAFSNL